jgi:hypothetical protein
MKPQKSQQREQPLRLHILGFSCLRARDLSLKNIPARLQRLRDRKSGGTYRSLYCAEFNFCTSLSMQFYGKNKNFCMESFRC